MGHGVLAWNNDTPKLNIRVVSVEVYGAEGGLKMVFGSFLIGKNRPARLKEAWGWS